MLGSKQKKRREEELGTFSCVGIASHSQGALPNFQRLVSDDHKTPTIRIGNSGRQTKEGKSSGYLSFFRRKQSRMLGKTKVKVTENYVENTDFAHAATSRPGHMPRQLPARLSGIRSIASPHGHTFSLSIFSPLRVFHTHLIAGHIHSFSGIGILLVS